MIEPLLRVDEPGYAPLHLRDYWHVVLRRRWLAFVVCAGIAGAGALRIALVRPLYQATSQILIDRNVAGALDFSKEVRAEEAWEDFYQTQYRLLQSRLLAGRVIDALGLASDPEFAGSPGRAGTRGREGVIDSFLGRLKVDPLKNSQLVEVTFQSYRPERASQVANAVVDAYVRQTQELRHNTSAEAGASLGTEAGEQAQKVQTAEHALRDYTVRKGLGNIEERRLLLNQKLKDLGAALTAAKLRRMDKEALYRQMRSATSVEELPEVINSPLVVSLRTELASLERQNAQLGAKGYLEDHPEAVKVRDQIEDTHRRIASEATRIVRGAENDYRVALAQEESAESALESVRRDVEELEHRSMEYDTLKRDLEASKDVSAAVLARQKEADAATDVGASNVHVIDRATVPAVAFRPRPLRDGLLSLLLGLVCGAGAAFLRDYMDTSVSKPGDLTRLGIPLLAVIPEMRARRGSLLAMNGNRKEPFCEGYRLLRAALGRPTRGAPGQILAVTSTLPGEGKSLTSANLALTLASTEERVLLVEADLRRPSLSGLLGVKRVPGVCEVVCGVATPAQAIQRVPGTRLGVMASGSPVHSSPADLLATGALRDLFASLAGSYDRVVVDMPPAGAVADAMTLAPLADGVVLVVQCGQVAANELQQILDRLLRAGSQVLGVVLNRARPDRHRYDYGPSLAPGALPARSGLLPPANPRLDSLGRLH
jgi:polysaccharide biosynthesis transport protein